MKSLKTLHKELWALTSQYIRLKEHYVCFTCGAQLDKNTSNCGHFLHNAKTSKIAYEHKILHCQCVRCNHHLSGNLLEYTLKMVRKYGMKQVNQWKREASKPYKWKRSELEEKLSTVKKQLKRLEK